MRLAIFVGEKDQGFGGMQTHLKNVIKYFLATDSISFIIYRLPELIMCDYTNNTKKVIKDNQEIVEAIKEVDSCFFVDGYWIDIWKFLRQHLQGCLFIFRTGGNEFVKAPYEDNVFILDTRQKLWAKLISQCMDFVISNSRYTTKRLEIQGIDVNQILTIRGGVDIKECQRNKSNRCLLRKRFDDRFMTKGKIIFAIVSRFEPFKGIMEILNVFSEYKDRMDFFILLVGDGSERQLLEDYCKSNLHGFQYVILPSTDNKTAMQYIAIADFYINCSKSYKKRSGNDEYIHTETMGRSLYEAIYQNIPVIATNVGGIKELFDEHEQIGILIEDDINEKRNIIESILNKRIQIKSCGERFIAYGWKYITSNLYNYLFRIKQNCLSKNVALCLDIDGTIYHKTLSQEDNEKNLKQIISMSECCEIVFNSAANYDEILDRYQILKEYSNKITIISNCGKHLYINGKQDSFWENYTSGVPGIQSHIVKSVIERITSGGIKITELKFIDKLYLNMKVSGIINIDTIMEVNHFLEDTEYMLVYNSSNLKLISRILNKASPIRYLIRMNKNIGYWIGAGNNVLDYAFMDVCNKAYIVNHESINYNMFIIKNNSDMIKFMNMLKTDIGEYQNENRQ